MTRHELVSKLANAIVLGVPEYQGHTLPSPQTTGTSMQRISYANSQAEKLADKMLKNDEKAQQLKSKVMKLSLIHI